jgi:hypothetical protein
MSNIDQFQENFDWQGSPEGWEQRQLNRDIQARESRARFEGLPSWANPDTDIEIGVDPETGFRRFQSRVGNRQYLWPDFSNTEQYPIHRSGGPVATAQRIYEAIPPMENWRLPTREELGTAAGFVGDMVQHVIETPTNPNATLADVWDVGGAAMTGGLAGASMGAYPRDSLGIFGGRRAERPGETRSGQPAPESTGADSQWRFEIDDSEMMVVPENISEVRFLGASTTRDASTLGDVLVHQELFYQYPELRDISVVFNRELIGTDTLGYFSPERNSIAIRPGLDESELRRVLIHELQHKIQEIEDFSRGTSRDAPEVSQRLEQASSLDREQELRLAEASRQNAIIRQDEIAQNVTESSVRQFLAGLKNFYEEYFESLGFVRGRDYRISNEGQFVGPTGEPLSWRDYPAGTADLARDFYLLEDLTRANTPFHTRLSSRNVAEDYNAHDAHSTLSDFWERLRFNAQEFNPETLPLLEDIVNNRFGVSFDNFVDDFFNLTPLSSTEFRPLRRPTGDPFNPRNYRDFAYRTAMGEVEAANAANRLDLSLAERFNASPESTEDFSRYYQWDNRTSGVSDMFVGERAGIRLPELERARELESAGNPPEEIWRETMWVRGPDGFWRTEISDEFFELSPEARLRIQSGQTTQGMEFGQVFNHPDLVQAYPETMTSERGWINARQGAANSGVHYRANFADGHQASRINVEGRDVGEIEDILLHELQHSVQNLEGFSPGFNPTSAQRIIDRTVGRFNPEIQDYALRRLGYQTSSNKFYALHEYLQNPQEFFSQNLGSFDPYIQRIVDQHRLGRQDRIQQAYETEARGMRAFRESMEEFESNFPRSAREVTRMLDFILTPSAYTLYRRNAGEIEANLTTDRRHWYEEDRRATFPNLAPEHTWTQETLQRDLDHMLRIFRDDNLLNDAQ